MGCSPAAEVPAADALVGFFQLFRPNGENLEGVFDGINVGDQLAERLEKVFSHAGDNQRPKGGRDAYFIVRNPRRLAVEQAEHQATNWIEGLQKVAVAVGDTSTSERLAKVPKIRVLEGIPPKNPKQDHEKTELFKAVAERSTELTEQIDDIDPHADLLRRAYYFISCDAMLRDYLMWPFYARQTGLADPLKGYFALWSHGVKFRIYQEQQIDLYLPREYRD